MKRYAHSNVRKPGSWVYGGISAFCSSRYEKDFCYCYQNYLRRLWLKFFIFQMSARWFPWHPKGPLLNPEFFSDILATTSRIHTLYGLETWYVQSSRHRIIKRCRKPSNNYVTARRGGGILESCYITDGRHKIWEHEKHFLAFLVRYKIIQIKSVDQNPPVNTCKDIIAI